MARQGFARHGSAWWAWSTGEGRPRLIFPLLAVGVLAGCAGDAAPGDDLGKAKYDADKAHCDSISTIGAAQKSCMTYRGWKDGKYHR